MTNLEKALTLVFGAEGGYVNDPQDPGGETKYGISKRAHPNVDIKNLTMADAAGIYAAEYWNVPRCDDWAWPLCAYVFDTAVLQGPTTAIRLLQKAAGLSQTGILPRNQVVAIQRRDQRELCGMFLADRALRFTGTKNFDHYGRGWFKRLFLIAMDT